MCLRNDRDQVPSLSGILNNSIRIHLETSIGEYGNLQFYCGLKLTQNTTTGANKLYLSSSSSTLILDDAEIPALKEFTSEASL
ncbi:hypothetical protein OROHE_014826 [Orobanche hederae]